MNEFGRKEATSDVRTQPSKTFTTRRGALLLFSEDYGASVRHLNRRQMHHRKRLRRLLHRKHRLGGVELEEEEEEKEDENEEGSQAEHDGLRTVDDLAKSILSYGSPVSRKRGKRRLLCAKFNSGEENEKIWKEGTN